MNHTKKKTTIPNHGPPQNSLPSEVISYFIDPAEIIAKYGKPIRPWKRGVRK